MRYEEARNLLQCEKYIIKGDDRYDDITLHLDFSRPKRYHLVCRDHPDVYFMWQISQSQKMRIRISLHVQTKDSYTGLMRIDYNPSGSHKNPIDILPDVPTHFIRYTDMYINESHIHYCIDGYKPLAWAVPLSDDVFKVKTITEECFNTELEHSIRCFARTITVITNIKIPQYIL